MDIANLIIRVTNEGLDRATRELRRLQDQAAGAQSANERFGKSIADLNKLAMVGFGALTAVVGGSIKTAIDFEKAMAGVAKTVDFATDNGLANMKKGIEDLTKVIPLAFEELAEIAAVGGQLGVAEQDILGFTETIAKMGVAFDIPAEQAADSMAKIANGFKIPIAEIGTLGDTINTVSNSMAATAGDVINFMGRVGGSSAALKISADNVAALGGAMAALNMQPEVAATAFNSLSVTLAKFDNLSKSQKSGFAKLGLDTKEFAETIKTDGLGAIMQVLEASKELDGIDAIAALNLAFGEAGTKIADMAEGMDTVKFALDQVGVGADGVSKTLGSMQAEFESVSSTTANKLQLVQNNMRLLAAGVGEAFLPAVNELLASLVPVIEKMTAWAQANPELIVQIAKVTASVLGAIIAMAAISGAIGTVISTFQGLSAIFGVAKIAILALSGPIGLTVMAITGLIMIGVLLYQNWDTIKAKALEIWGAIKSYVVSKSEEAKQGLINAWNGAKTAVVNKLNEIADGIVNALKALPAKMLGIGKNIVSGLIDGIKSGASGVASAIGSMASSAVTRAKSVLDIRSPSRVMKKVGEQTAEGMAVGIKKGAKAVKTEAQKMAESAVKAVQDGVANLKREIALFGNDSPVAALKYDISVGKFGGADTSQLMSLTQTKEQLELSKKLADANKSVQDSIDGLIKQQALFGNNSSLASLMYDIEHTDKYKDATKELTDKLIEQTRALEQLGMTAKATDAIRNRFSKLQADTEASNKAVDGVMAEIASETPLGKIEADYARRLAIITENELLITGVVGSEIAKREAIEKSYMDAKRDLMLTQGEALFGDLSDLAKGFAGEQSGIYKTMFAIEKAFAIAQSAIAIQTAVAKAMAVGVTPIDRAINIGSAISAGAGIMSTLMSISGKGFKQGGYTGNMGASQVAGVVHGQEYVFDAQATKRIGVDNLNAMRSGKAVGGDVQVNIINNSSARVTASDDGRTITIEDVRNEARNEIKHSWTNTGNPNSFESKQLNRNIQAPRRR